MEWKNIIDRKPNDNQVVLASIDGVYKIVRFSAAQDAFIELATRQPFFLKDQASPLYWAEIENPIS